MSNPSPAKRGRPKRSTETKRIRLEVNVFNEWMAKKDSLGFAEKSHGDFAKYLMNTLDARNERGSTSSVGKSEITIPCLVILSSLLYHLCLGTFLDDGWFLHYFSSPVLFSANEKPDKSTLIWQMFSCCR